MNLLPSAEAWKLFDGAGCPPWVKAHTQCVHALAVRIAEALGADVEMVSSGAILHDVGRGITQDPTHAYLGSQWLESKGVPEPIVRIIARHTGAGLTEEDAKSLGLPHALMPETLEEKIVAHADNMFSGSKPLTLDGLQRKYEAKGLDSAWLRIEALHQELGISELESWATSASKVAS